MAESGLTPREELDWRQYNSYLSLFRFYLSTLIKLNTFHYAVTGAIVSFVVAHPEVPEGKWALALPFAFSVLFGVILGICYYPAKVLEKAINDLRANLKYPTAPAILVLRMVIAFFFALHLTMAIGLAYLFLMTPFKATSKALAPSVPLVSSHYGGGKAADGDRILTSEES